MLKFPRLILLAIALLLWGCAQESPVGAEPEKEPEKEPEPPTPPEILVLRIDPSTDTIAFPFYSFVVVSAGVYRPDGVWLNPQPEILWSISTLAGTEITADTVGPLYWRLQSTGVGLARIIVRSPALGLADTAVVRSWSPVASLLFELERDTVVERGHIDWRIEARDADGSFVNRSLVSVTASPVSLAQVNLKGGTGMQLGTGTITARALPFSIARQLTVVPLLVDQLHRGDVHSCVRRDDLQIMCSGQNAYLQLGRETPLQCFGSAGQYCFFGSAGWVEVPGLDEVIAFDVARLYACAIRVGGELLCWGASNDGQLGTTVDNEYCGSPNAGYWFITCVPGPRPVASELRFRTISAGGSTACALTVDDKAWCWGTTAYGARLGNGSTEGSSAPSPVSGGHSFRTIAAGEHTTCAADFSDAAWCWGEGALGQLGAGAEVATAVVPTRVVGDISFLTVQNGVWGTCGLSTAGQAFCWGGANAFQGGIPLPAAGELRFTEIAVGGEVCGATAGGEVWCWNADAPQHVSGIPPLTRITVTSVSGCGISANQTSHCWLNGTRAATTITSR